MIGLKTTPPAAVLRVNNRESRGEAGKPLESFRLHGENGSRVKVDQLEKASMVRLLRGGADRGVTTITCRSRQRGSE